MSYIPERGDIIWVDFDPQAGKEIKKRRPALVLTKYRYNKTIGRCILIPASSKVKNYPFEVLTEIEGKKGAFQIDQIKSFDWKIRKAKFIQKAEREVMEEVEAKLYPLLFEIMNLN